MSEDNNTLHFLRVRDREDKAFSDPNADIRTLFSTVIADALDILEKCGTEPEQVSDLAGVFYVFNTKLLEDSAPLDKQLDQLLERLRQLDYRLVDKFMRICFIELLISSAMFRRRDSKTDGESFAKMHTSMVIMALRDRCPELADEICKRYSEHMENIHFPEYKFNDTDAHAMCEETGAMIPHIKQHALKLIGAEPGASWERAAELCDKFWCAANESGTSNDRDMVITSLAFPSYEHPTNEAGVLLDEEDTDK